jgi:hypothetical protein
MTDITPGAAPAVGFLHNPHSPDIFADSAAGFFIFNGNIRITFESLRADHGASPGPVTRVAIGRLVMLAVQAEAFAKGLLEFMEKHRSQEIHLSKRQ